jgi:hypothetical protein
VSTFEIAQLSADEIETLCVLRAVGQAGCPVLDLAPRLGLSTGVAAELAAGMVWLEMFGLLSRADDRFALTEAGRAKLAAVETLLSA